jgi:hypothetical protein
MTSSRRGTALGSPSPPSALIAHTRRWRAVPSPVSASRASTARGPPSRPSASMTAATMSSQRSSVRRATSGSTARRSPIRPRARAADRRSSSSSSASPSTRTPTAGGPSAASASSAAATIASDPSSSTRVSAATAQPAPWLPSSRAASARRRADGDSSASMSRSRSAVEEAGAPRASPRTMSGGGAAGSVAAVRSMAPTLWRAASGPGAGFPSPAGQSARCRRCREHPCAQRHVGGLGLGERLVERDSRRSCSSHWPRRRARGAWTSGRRRDQRDEQLR